MSRGSGPDGGLRSTGVALSCLQTRCRYHDRDPPGFTPLLVVFDDQQGRQRLLDMEPDLVGQHSKEHVSSDAVLPAVTHRMHLQVKRFHGPERLLNLEDPTSASGITHSLFLGL